MPNSRLVNYNSSLLYYVSQNAGTNKSLKEFTFTDLAKPQGCGDVDIKILLGYPEDMEDITTSTIVIDDPMMPDNPMIGLVEEADLRIYVIYGFILGQDINYNRRLRDRLAERFRDMFKKGVNIPILNFDDALRPTVDNAWIEYSDVKILKPLSQTPTDRFKFSCTINLRGYFEG